MFNRKPQPQRNGRNATPTRPGMGFRSGSTSSRSTGSNSRSSDDGDTFFGGFSGGFGDSDSGCSGSSGGSDSGSCDSGGSSCGGGD